MKEQFIKGTDERVFLSKILGSELISLFEAVAKKYIGLSSVWNDEEQIVRDLATQMRYEIAEARLLLRDPYNAETINRVKLALIGIVPREQKFIESEKKRTGLNEKIKEKGMTQQQLADMLGVNQSAISNWCNGYNLPSTDKLLKLEKILECPISELLSKEG